MGNRAVITTKEMRMGIYLHWNGGRDLVEAFLLYCKLKGYRSPDSDSYGWARLAQTIANYFSDGLSIGIDSCDNLDMDNGDNGTYIIEGWEIVGREYFDGREQRDYQLRGMIEDINDSQPKEIQLDPIKIDQHFTEYIIKNETEGFVMFAECTAGVGYTLSTKKAKKFNTAKEALEYLEKNKLFDCEVTPLFK